eukprot:3974822-Ditylum_brightwellii.AAC.1
MAVVGEVDVKGRVLDLQDSDDDACALGNDGGGGGPAPLQIVQLPDVDFEDDSNLLTDDILSPGGTTATYH